MGIMIGRIFINPLGGFRDLKTESASIKSGIETGPKPTEKLGETGRTS